MKKKLTQMKRFRKKAVSLMLVVALVVTGVHLDTLSQSVYAAKETKTEKKENKKKKVVKEIKSEQTENSNTYLMSDGSRKMEIYKDNIRYKENGTLKEYDSTLKKLSAGDRKELKKVPKDITGEEAGEYTYVNTQGDTKQYFAENISEDTPVILTKNSYSIGFAPVTEEEKDKDSQKTDIKEEQQETEDTVRPEESTYKETEKSKKNITYADEDKKTEYKYYSLTNGVKEEIILNEKPETNIFEFSYEAEGVRLERDKKTDIIKILDSKTSKEAGYIYAPNIIDENGLPSYEHITYDLTENKDESYTLKIEVDENYLEQAAYPVTIDPTLVWNNKTEVEIGYVINGNNPDAVTSATKSFPIFGRTISAYTYIKFPELADIINGKKIIKAKMDLTKKQMSIGTIDIGVYQVSGDWSENTLTWNNRPEIGTKNFGIMTDNGDNKYTVSFTEWVQQVADGKITNDYGIALYGNEGSGFASTFCGLGAENEADRPVFTIEYAYGMEQDAVYDGSFLTEGEYHQENKTVQLQWENPEQNADRYYIYRRADDSDTFDLIDQTDGTFFEAGTEDADTIDFRVMAVKDGENGEQETKYLSNILTYKKESITSEDEEGNETTEETYELSTTDTDGDGLEDGYEIWDFRTLWNTRTQDSTEENPVYEMDSDGDGFPDSYEVFTLGTDPAEANEEGKDSDGDGWSDLKEYREGTDPWLKDSDFDGTNDRGDSSPRKTGGHTRQTVAAEAVVHKGLYEREYSETEEGVTTTYITNIYRNDVKKISTDYGDSSLNKTMKYFYDAEGNNTAIIEAYDESYDPNHTQTICITYTYDEKGNVIYICDQSTKYTMSYDEDGNMSGLKVGNVQLIHYAQNVVENHEGEDGEAPDVAVGGIIRKDENTTTYGNGQTMKTVTTTYKVAEDDTTSMAVKAEVYNGNENTPSYVTETNGAGEILKLTDNTKGSDKAVTYTYTYTDDTAKVTRSDGFTKERKTEEDEENSKTTISTKYTYKNLKGEDATYTSVNKSDTSDENVLKAEATFNNGDILNSSTSADGKTATQKLYSKLYKKNILTGTQTEESSTHTTLTLGFFGENKKFDYTYDKAGNITEIKQGGKTVYEYTYDAHGRLTGQKDYTVNESHEYEYNTTGNMHADCIYPLDENGNKVTSEEKIKYYKYENDQWPDQLTSYNGKEITYDNMGNPLNYLNGMSFSWDRGRQLKDITFENGEKVSYNYNENGLRTYKDTKDATTTYEWDETTLIRETVAYKATGKKYDVWYFYDTEGNAAGFEYSQLNDTGSSLTKTRIYYEKNLQGDVIGLLDSRGIEIATYAYDAWGNVTGTLCYEGNETPYALNHITYRGYYRDDETGFYYLQSRYYDAEVGRFVNADDVKYLGASGTVWGYNLYSYCENNPIIFKDSTGEALINIILAGIFGVAGWFFGDWLAYKVVKKKNWKYWTFRAAITVGGAAIGWFAGSLIAKYVLQYLRNHPEKIFKLADKWGAKRFYDAMAFLGINPFSLAMNGSKFVAIVRALNSKQITLGYEWAKQLYYKAISLGYKVELHKPHQGYSWHMHLHGNKGKLSNQHIQVVKSVWDYLSKLIK